MSHGLSARLTAAGCLGYERLDDGAEKGHRMVVFQGDTADAVRPPEEGLASMGMALGVPAPLRKVG